MKKDFISYILFPFSCYTTSFLLSKLLLFLGSLKFGVFSSILQIFGMLFEIPTSKFDIIVMSYNIEEFVLLIGFIGFIYYYNRMFNCKI